MYRRSRFNEELGQSPVAENPAVNAPSDIRVDMSPSPEGPGKSDLRLSTEGLVGFRGKKLLALFFQQIKVNFFEMQSYLCRTVSVCASSRFLSCCLSSGPQFPFWKFMVSIKASFCIFFSMVGKNDVVLGKDH